MPTYEFSCPDCGAAHDRVYAMADVPKRIRCDRCGAWAIKAILTAPSIRPDLNDFSQENGGKGRWNPQLRTYTKSRQDTIDQGRRRGWSPAT